MQEKTIVDALIEFYTMGLKQQKKAIAQLRNISNFEHHDNLKLQASKFLDSNSRGDERKLTIGKQPVSGREKDIKKIETILAKIPEENLGHVQKILKSFL